MAALSAATVAVSAAAVARCVSYWSRVISPRCDQASASRQLSLRVLQGRRVAGEHRLGLPERGLERPRVQAEQRLALLDLLAFGEVMVLSCPVTCARICTLEMASTVPTAGRVTGIGFCSTRAVSDGHGAAGASCSTPPPAGA